MNKNGDCSLTEDEKRETAEAEIKVTVVCVTYNHEKYIAQALDSFLGQKTSFRFQIFVGEDCGTDRTAEIVRRYAEEHPGVIIPFIREKNMGPQRNCLDMCSHARSPYIALCDGDDYWIDEFKLQKQFDYMEAHPDYRFCFAKTQILPPNNWDLRNYYIANEEGKYIIPDCLPSHTSKEPPYHAKDFSNDLMDMGHTSTYFFRWNYGLIYPDWFFDGVMGDGPLRLMQLGNGCAGCISDVVSVYRINETGVFTSYESKDELFLNTRKEYIRWLSGMLDWYSSQGFEDYPKSMLTNRLNLEMKNLANAALNTGEYDRFAEIITNYPTAARVFLSFYLSSYNDRRAIEGVLGWEGYQALVRSPLNRRMLKPLAKRAIFRNNLRKKMHNSKAFVLYWLYALPKKNDAIWVASGFRGKSYSDNARYFYEFVCDHHPEIEMYWFTRSDEVYSDLKERGRRVIKEGTKECKRILSRAAIAVIDHYASTDYSISSGFNARTKVVQLWHGLALKSVVDADGNNNAGEKSVRSSVDLLPLPSDSFPRRMIKKIKYFRYSYCRELYENYFLFLTPGQEMVEHIGHGWGIPEDCYFMSGYPRTISLFDCIAGHPQNLKVLYAPTYRWNPDQERALLELFFESLSLIQEKMEILDGTLVLRLHPHTWRNYQTIIREKIRPFDRIKNDTEEDAYGRMGEYSIGITDYSSTMIDFALMHRPTIFLAPDLEEYRLTDCGVIRDYKERIPGPLVETWGEALDQIAQYAKDPHKDEKWALERLGWFYNPQTTDSGNSERIVQEIKRRLK